MSALPKARIRPRKKPVQRRSRETVDVLLRAAARVLVRRGYAGTTTNHIAAAAGVSIGSLYEYFPGKEAIVAALAGRHLDEAEALLGARLAEALLQAPARPLEATLRALVSAMLALHADDPRLHRVLSEEVPRLPELRERVARLEDAGVRALEALIAAHPEASVADAPVAARLVVDLVEAATHRWVLDGTGSPVPAERMAEELTRMLTLYLRGDGAARRAIAQGSPPLSPEGGRSRSLLR
jgi:AcrR family transcriptional regulator